MPQSALPARFWEKVKIDRNGCWAWTACLNDYGYGQYWHDGSTRQAHRVSYEILVGPIPGGLDLDHLCRVRSCVNPGHLEPVTKAENTLRGMGRGAINRRKTHCKRGHEFTEASIYQRSDGRRNCILCNHIREGEGRKNAASRLR